MQFSQQKRREFVTLLSGAEWYGRLGADSWKRKRPFARSLSVSPTCGGLCGETFLSSG